MGVVSGWCVGVVSGWFVGVVSGWFVCVVSGWWVGVCVYLCVCMSMCVVFHSIFIPAESRPEEASEGGVQNKTEAGETSSQTAV